MNYAAIKPYDIANGPGVRTSLFVSGCTHHCKGCFQPETWDFSYGEPFTQDVIDTILHSLEPDYVAGLTLLGGEPFEPANQPAVAELLRQLRADGVVSAVVSNKPDYAVKTLSEQYFPGLLAASAGAKEGVRKKPCPDSVFEVVRQLGAEALRAVYIGDSEVDLQTAQNAALPCISVSWGFRDRSVLEQAGAACICDTVDALYQAICNG